jgi:hypothetical protein
MHNTEVDLQPHKATHGCYRSSATISPHGDGEIDVLREKALAGALTTPHKCHDEAKVVLKSGYHMREMQLASLCLSSRDQPFASDDTESLGHEVGGGQQGILLLSRRDTSYDGCQPVSLPNSTHHSCRINEGTGVDYNETSRLSGLPSGEDHAAEINSVGPASQLEVARSHGIHPLTKGHERSARLSIEIPASRFEDTCMDHLNVHEDGTEYQERSDSGTDSPSSRKTDSSGDKKSSVSVLRSEELYNGQLSLCSAKDSLVALPPHEKLSASQDQLREGGPRREGGWRCKEAQKDAIGTAENHGAERRVHFKSSAQNDGKQRIVLEESRISSESSRIPKRMPERPAIWTQSNNQNGFKVLTQNEVTKVQAMANFVRESTDKEVIGVSVRTNQSPCKLAMGHLKLSKSAEDNEAGALRIGNSGRASFRRTKHPPHQQQWKGHEPWTPGNLRKSVTGALDEAMDVLEAELGLKPPRNLN